MDAVDIKHDKVVPCNPPFIPTYLTGLVTELDSEAQLLQADLFEVGIFSPQLLASHKYRLIATAKNRNAPQHGEVGCTSGEIQHNLSIGVQHPCSRHNDNWRFGGSHRKSRLSRYNHPDLPIATSQQDMYHVPQAIF
jgi:hypothetical protein